MTIIAGDATDGVRTGLAGRIANRIATIFGAAFAAGTNDAKGLNAIAFGIVDALNNDKIGASQFGAPNPPAISYATNSSPSFGVGAGSNVFTDLPGTSQSFTPGSSSKQIKATLTFSGYAGGAPGPHNIQLAIGGSPSGATIYGIYWNTMAQHQSWSFVWLLAAGALGLVGTPVVVSAQIRSPPSSPAYQMDAWDSSTLLIEEIG